MDTTRYVIGLLLVLALPPGLLWWFVVHPFVGFWRGVGVRATMTVLTVLSLAGMVGLYTVRDLLMGPDLGTHWVLVAVGVGLMAAAALLAVKRKRHLTFRILAGIPELETDPERTGELLTHGLYARIRHPRYVEVALGVFGYAVLSNHVGPYVMAVATLPILHLIVLMEERELRERFGDAYREYEASVPRYLPRREV